MLLGSEIEHQVRPTEVSIEGVPATLVYDNSINPSEVSQRFTKSDRIHHVRTWNEQNLDLLVSPYRHPAMRGMNASLSFLVKLTSNYCQEGLEDQQMRTKEKKQLLFHREPTTSHSKHNSV
ncbi:hypothetical protein EYC80_000692 [Monilinia laxa]|uniref:Uncharacterized protein n=1 Tax=Monilinia laxa TaxID=61186 RepID=A0A5N6KBN9_MONLA|nr:hypothetical protein EYC80_000692 [Monilinia laxa]